MLLAAVQLQLRQVTTGKRQQGYQSIYIYILFRVRASPAPKTHWQHLAALVDFNSTRLRRAGNCTIVNRQTAMADPKTLMEQLRLFAESPDAFQFDEAQKQDLFRLSRQAAAALESSFETLQRLVYSVRTAPSHSSSDLGPNTDISQSHCPLWSLEYVKIAVSSPQ